MKKLIYLVFAATVLYSCTSTTGDANSTKTSDASFDVSRARQSIEASNKQFADAVMRGDSASVVSRYHTDAIVYPPNMPADKKTFMGSLAANASASGVKTFALNTGNVTGNEDQVVETGTYEMGDESKTIDKGKYIVVWKPENGEWKMWLDIWNSDNPPAPVSQ